MTKSAYLLIGSISLLFAIGLLMVFNTTSAELLDRSLASNTHQALLKQCIYAILGILCGLIFYFIGYEKVIEKAPFLFVLCTILLLFVFFPEIGHQINGAKRWIGLFGFSLQPSEFAKYILPMYFIYRIQKIKKPIDFRSFLKILSLLAVPTALILIEPDNGTTAIIMLTFMVLFFLVRIPFLYWIVPVLIILFIGGLAASQMPHVPDRIRIYLNPELDLQGRGHQPHQAKIAAGSGKLWGKGLGESLQKLSYLPEARSDYIAAIYAEEFGFMGILLLIGIYMLIAFSGFSIAVKCPDKMGFYMASMISFLITFQAFLNLGVVSNLLPSKGTTLPFFSQGGSSLFANIIFLFILLSITRKQEAIA